MAIIVFRKTKSLLLCFLGSKNWTKCIWCYYWLSYWEDLKSYIVDGGFFSVFHVNMPLFFLHFCVRASSVPLGNGGNLSAIFLFAKQHFRSQITILLGASDTFPLSWGTEPCAYHLPASHFIRPPFNYRAEQKPVFPHHTPSTLRPSFNDEKSAVGDLGICFIIILFSFCHRAVCLWMKGGCFCTQPAYFWQYILLAGLKFDILSLEVVLSVFHTLCYSFSRMKCDFILNLSSLPLRMGL